MLGANIVQLFDESEDLSLGFVSRLKPFSVRHFDFYAKFRLSGHAQGTKC